MNETTGERTRKLDAEIWLILAIVAVLLVAILVVRDYSSLRRDVEGLKLRESERDEAMKELMSKRDKAGKR